MIYGELTEEEYKHEQERVKKIQSYLTVFFLGISAGILISNPLKKLGEWNYAQSHPTIQQSQPPTHTPQLNKSLLNRLNNK